MARTMVYDAQAGTAGRAKVGDIVYAIMNHTRQYKHTMHLVKRVREDGEAVTYCTMWLTFGAVRSNPTDMAIWCENGCLQAKRQAVEAN
jgi:hypothetical protein